MFFGITLLRTCYYGSAYGGISLMQKRHNSIADAMELGLFFIKP